MTAGTFVLNQWALLGNFASPTETLIIDDGAKIQSSSLIIGNGLSLQSNSTTPVWQASLQTTAFFVFSILENSLDTFLFSPNAPMFSLDAAVDFEVSLGAGTIGEGTHNVFSAAAGRTIAIADILGIITTHALGGAGTVNVGLGPSGIITLPQDVTTLNVVKTGEASQIVYTAATLANWSGTNPSSVQNALDRIAAHTGPIP